jgi:uncharacterized membrane protein
VTTLTPTPGFAEPRPTFSWLDAWRVALTRPSLATYTDLLLDPKISLRRAIGWLFSSSLLSYLIGVGIQALVLPGVLAEVIRDAAETAPAGVGLTPTVLLVLSLACTPFLAAFVLLTYLVGFGVMHFIASALGSEGSYTELVYAHAAYLAPMTLLTTLLGMIPVVNCLTLPLGLYAFGLQLMALKASTRLGWGRVFATLLIVGLLIGLVVVVLGLAVFAPELERWLSGAGVSA